MKNVKKGFALMRDVLWDGFQIECFLFNDIQKVDIRSIDRGLRDMMWADFAKQTDLPAWAAQLFDKQGIMVLKSNLGFYNIIIALHTDEGPVYILTEAFRDQEANAYYFDQIVRQGGASQEQLQHTESIFRQLPVAKPITILAIIRRTLGEYCPKVRNMEPTVQTFLEEKHVENPTPDEVRYQAQYSENYRKYLLEYLEALRQGDGEKARRALLEFLNHTNFDSCPLPLLKQRIYQINNYSARELLGTSVHPRHILKLQRQFGERIASGREETALAYLPYDICHKYLLLVKNNRLEQYSKVVREIVTYVELHLDEELTLEVLAEQFGRNPSSLSNQFSKETGTSLTQYIKQVRVHEAIRLLNTTKLPISEIAVEVGYEDFAYFSRVFKQIIGVSPRAYRNAM